MPTRALRSLALLAVSVLAAGSCAVATAAPAAATTAPAVFAVRIEDGGDGSFAAVHGVDGGTVASRGLLDGRVEVTGSHPVAGQSRQNRLVVPQGLPVGSYSTSSSDPSFRLPGAQNGCDAWKATMTVRSAVWLNGLPTRLSVSGVLECTTGWSTRAWTEIRIGEPAGSVVGQLRADRPVGPGTTQIGTPVDVTVPVVNEGSGPVTAGRASLRLVSDPEYPGYSVKTDGCVGRVLQPQQSCQVVLRYDPQWYARFSAVLSVPDGRPGAAERYLAGSATEQPDQPVQATAAGLDRAVQVRWSRPRVTTTGGAYERFDVLRTGPDGQQVTVASVPWVQGQELYRVIDPGLADRTDYSYAVRVHLLGGSAGPVSRTSRTRTAGRLLLFLGDAGPTQLALDPAGKPAPRLANPWDVVAHAVSPDGATWAVASRSWTGVGYRCVVSTGPRTATADLTPVTVTVPVDLENVCDADPTFTGNRTIVLSHVDDTRYPATPPRLVRVDLDTGAATDLPGGQGLVQPSAAPDGSLVAVEEATRALVRVTPDGQRTAVPGGDSAADPAVSATGDIAFLRLVGYDRRVTVLPAAGGEPRVVSPPGGHLTHPSWFPDGTRVLWHTSDINGFTGVLAVDAQGGEPQVVLEVAGSPAPLVVDVPDTSAPLTTLPSSQPWTTTPTATWTATAVDPGPSGSGVASYDARYRSGPAGGTLSGWTSPPAWTAATSPAFTLPVTSGTRYCVSARATDALGQTGAWSAETCTTADRMAPSLTSLSTPAPWSPHRVLSLTWSYSDAPSGVASYRVRHRSAPIGGALGAHTVLGPTTARSWSVTMPAGSQYCVSVLARDAAGNQSAWSPERCSSAALDERSMAAAGSTRTVSSTAYFGGSARELLAARAQVSYGKVHATRVGVVLTTCSTCGVVDVLHNGVRLGQLSGRSATTRHRVLVWLPRSAARSGPLVIRTVDNRRVFVDAVVVQHQ